MFTPEQLHADGKMRAEHQDIADNSHIYLICKRPKATCDKEQPVIKDGIVSGRVFSRVKGEAIVSEYRFPFEFEEDEVNLVVADYPHRKIQTIKSDGSWERYWPSDLLALYTGDEIYYKLEVLYVGQAFAEGRRTAIERLKNHSTLQKILAETMSDYPDDQVFIFTLVYDDYVLFSSMDGRDKDSIAGEQDDSRLKSIIHNHLSKKEIICLAEAGLIRYFQPKYNAIYRESFPSSDQKILAGCFNLDFSGLTVEVELNDSHFKLYSDKVISKYHHLAAFNLADEEERLGFFTLSDGVKTLNILEDVIKMER
ncbi:TPA: hypothetical protein M4243_003246 [Klebsiella variicola]|nr:hypothetical protein [Klebsiella variicola]HDK6429996.1 hypothetical protein [Klebsiella variicola]